MAHMNGTSFYQRPLIRLLIISYVLLLIFVIFFQYRQYHRTQSALGYVNTIAQRGVQKLELLTGMNKAVGYIQLALMHHVYAVDRRGVSQEHQMIHVQTTHYNSNFRAYEKLKKTKEEQRIFDGLRQFKNDNDRATDSLLFKQQDDERC